jgi:hypothetical protein
MLYPSGAVAQIWIGSSIEAERPHVGVEAQSRDCLLKWFGRRRPGETGDGGGHRGAARPGTGRCKAKTLTRFIPFGPHLVPFRALKCETILELARTLRLLRGWRKQDRGSRRQPGSKEQLK